MFGKKVKGNATKAQKHEGKQKIIENSIFREYFVIWCFCGEKLLLGI